MKALKKALEPLTLAVFLVVAAFGIAGCEPEGSFEQAGEEVDEAADQVGDALEDAGDEIEDAADDARN
jgi:hypothetical protein